MSRPINILSISPEGRGFRFSSDELLINDTKREYIIGRESRDLLILPETNTKVSAKHIKIVVEKDKTVRISHYSPVRATYLNGVRLYPECFYPIYPGDTIYLTDYEPIDAPVVVLKVLPSPEFYASLFNQIAIKRHSELDLDSFGKTEESNFTRWGQDLGQLKNWGKNELEGRAGGTHFNKVMQGLAKNMFKGIAPLTKSEHTITRALYNSTLNHKRPDNRQEQIKYTALALDSMISPKGPLSRPLMDVFEWDDAVAKVVNLNPKALKFYGTSYEEYTKNYAKEETKATDRIKFHITNLRRKLDRNHSIKDGFPRDANKHQHLLIKQDATGYYMERVHDFQKFSA